MSISVRQLAPLLPVLAVVVAAAVAGFLIAGIDNRNRRARSGRP